MSQQLRQLKNRIRSVEGTWKVARAMEMVSTSKFKGVERPLQQGRLYVRKATSLLETLTGLEPGAGNPFLRVTPGVTGLLVITTDTGLCGVYNEHVLRLADQFLQNNRDKSIRLYVYGRKGVTHFRRKGIAADHVFPAIHGRPVGNFHAPILDVLLKDFLGQRITALHVAHTSFINAMKHESQLTRFLPLERPVVVRADPLVETARDSILDAFLPIYVSAAFRLLLLEALTAEFSARMVAMRSAKDNAKELMGDLILLRNKVRQTAITKEVIEIISSVEALKG